MSVASGSSYVHKLFNEQVCIELCCSRQWLVTSSIVRSHVTAPHVTAPHVTAPHVTAPHVTAPHVISLFSAMIYQLMPS